MNRGQLKRLREILDRLETEALNKAGKTKTPIFKPVEIEAFKADPEWRQLADEIKALGTRTPQSTPEGRRLIRQLAARQGTVLRQHLAG